MQCFPGLQGFGVVSPQVLTFLSVVSDRFAKGCDRMILP